MTPVQRPIEEEKKQPEPSQTVELAGEAANSALSADALPRVHQQPIETVQQSSDINQATLQAFQSILAQQLEEKLREQREQLEAKTQEQLRQQLKEQREQLEARTQEQLIELREQLDEKLREQKEQLAELWRSSER